LLFFIYINDICDSLTPGTKIRLFADDSLLYREIRSPEDISILQKDLDGLQRWESTWKMEFHPGKCQVLRITNKKKFIGGNYFIHNMILQEQPSAKYLGVIIDNKLKWKEQYSSVAKKANKMLAFLRRNLNDCPPKVKEECYKTIVRPALEYGSSVWDPHHRTDIDHLEKIQKRAARFVTGNYSHLPGTTKINMNKLCLKPLEERRAATKLSLLFKARHNLVEIPMDHLKLNSVSTRRSGAYSIPTSNLDCHLHSFYPSTVRLWNSLPEECKQAGSADCFKKHLDSITLRSAYWLHFYQDWAPWLSSSPCF